MRTFHVSLHGFSLQGWPDEVPDVESSDEIIEGERIPVILLAAGSILPPLAASFDEFFDSLAGESGWFPEPDGSFAWTGPLVPDRQDRPAWRIEGQAVDRGPRLDSVELKGTAPPAVLRRLFDAAGDSADGMLIQFVRHARYARPDAFLKWLSGV